MAVGDQQIDEAVVVEVRENFGAPAAQQPRGLREPVIGRGVGEERARVAFVEREHLVVDVGDEHVLPAVAIEVRRVDAHARAQVARRR